MTPRFRLPEEYRAGSSRVVIERGGIGFIVSDEGGEFARATTIDLALTYVADLLHGPRTATQLPALVDRHNDDPEEPPHNYPGEEPIR